MGLEDKLTTPHPKGEEDVEDVQIVLLSDANCSSLRELKSDVITKLVTIPGIIIKASGVRAKATKITIQCCNCQNIIPNLPLKPVLEIVGEGTTYSTVTAEEEDIVIRMAASPNIYERLANSIAPAIYGVLDIKKAITCLLFGGFRKRLPDELTRRGGINILLLGDPGAAKSRLLEFVEKQLQTAFLADGMKQKAMKTLISCQQFKSRFDTIFIIMNADQLDKELKDVDVDIVCSTNTEQFSTPLTEISTTSSMSPDTNSIEISESPEEIRKRMNATHKPGAVPEEVLNNNGLSLHSLQRIVKTGGTADDILNDSTSAKAAVGEQSEDDDKLQEYLQRRDTAVIYAEPVGRADNVIIEDLKLYLRKTRNLGYMGGTKFAVVNANISSSTCYCLLGSIEFLRAATNFHLPCQVKAMKHKVILAGFQPNT
ncbi:hypothetical protein FQA39_LY12078 [Lamprigera yunnana]|nr:hypothetical protein FQA39_LY12078 [Lamprigera yunnana]